MNSFEFNKMAGAVLGTLLVGMGLGLAGEAIFDHSAAKPGYDLPVPKPAVGGAAAPAPQLSLPALLAKADIKKGEADTHVCQVCHDFAKGGGVKIGPPLYGVVGRKVASEPGFEYSDALKKVGGVWTMAKLFQWIDDPAKMAPGTKMAFAGEPDPQKRADIIDYLHTLSAHPEPLPPVPAATASKPAAKSTASAADQLDAAIVAADPKQGEQQTHVCQVCHNFEKGAGVKIGPPLYGVVDRPIASVPGFDYSDALKKHKGEKWTYANLSTWITDPAKFAPGTKMSFAGEPELKKRAEIISYLRTLSDHPAPLPTAKKAEAAPPPAKAGAAPTKTASTSATGGSGDAALDAALAKGSADKGKQEAQICEVCHNVAKGEGAKIGPPLYGVVDRPIASVPGFEYSDTLKKHKGEKWTYANLSKWLTNPQAFASGTPMAFAGEPNLQKRADLILWLRTLADKPAPLPVASSAAGKAP